MSRDELDEQQRRNRRLADRVADGTAVGELREVVEDVRRMAAAHLDVPGPRALQILDALAGAEARRDVLRDRITAALRLLDELGDVEEGGSGALALADRVAAVLRGDLLTGARCPRCDLAVGTNRYSDSIERCGTCGTALVEGASS